MIKARVASETVEALEAQLAAIKAGAAQAATTIINLRCESENLEDFDAAKMTEREIEKLEWMVRAADRQIPDLIARLETARGERLARAIVKHQTRAEKRWAALRRTIEAAVTEQMGSIADRNEAEKEIGGHAADQYLPRLVYRGFLLSEFVDLWTAEMTRVMASMRPPPAVRLLPARRIAAAAEGLAYPGPRRVSSAATATSAPAPDAATRAAMPGFLMAQVGGTAAPRPPRPAVPAPEIFRAAAAAPSVKVDGHVRCQVQRSGYQDPTGAARARGEIVWLPPEIARIATGNGAVDYAGEAAA